MRDLKLRMFGDGLTAERPASLVIRAEYDDGGVDEITWMRPASVTRILRSRIEAPLALAVEVAGPFTVGLQPPPWPPVTAEPVFMLACQVGSRLLIAPLGTPYDVAHPAWVEVRELRARPG